MAGEKAKFGTSNKRKYLSHMPLDDPEKIPTTLELLAELGAIPPDDYRALCNMCDCNNEHDTELSELEPVQPSVENDYCVIPDADWSDFTESQLEELCMNNLDTIFKSAIKIIVASGFSEEVASKAILRTDLCYGSKDTVSNIVDNTLAVLQSGKEIDFTREQLFENLEQLEKYTLAEMVCVLREVNTHFNTGDAMWCLLICDMNVSHACAMDGDSLSFLGSDEATDDGSSVSVDSEVGSKNSSFEESQPNATSSNSPVVTPISSKSELAAAGGTPDQPYQTKTIACEWKPPERGTQISASNTTKRTSVVIEEHVQAKSQSSGSAAKPVGCKKGHPNGPKTILRQKIHMEKNYRGSWRTGRLSGFGGMFFDKKMKSVSDSIGMHPKNAALRIKKSMEVSIAHAQGEGHLALSVGTSISSASNKKTISTQTGLPKENTDPFLSLSSKNSVSSNLTTLCDVASDIIHNKRTGDNPPVLPKTNPALSLPSKSNATTQLTSSSMAIPDDSHGKKSVNPPPISAKANSEPSLPLPLENNDASDVTPIREMISEFSHLGVSYDQTTGNWVPHDKLDEVILKMASRARDLENQLGQWTDWANQKVIQATRRLNKDKSELKSLKQEKEEVKGIRKERQSVEDNTLRKLSEMENALSRATDQIEKADTAVSRLEVENSKLKQIMEEAKKRSAEATASYKEVSKREDEITKKLQSSESQKTSLREELTMLKRKRLQLENEVDQAQKSLNQSEARYKQGKKEKDEVLAQVESISKAREQIEMSTKLVEDRVRTKSENELQKHKDRIHDLEFQVIQLTLKTDPSKMSALHWGTDGSYSSSLTNGKVAEAIKGNNQASYTSKLKAIFQENLQNKLVKRDRECVMCLTEEMSVVFLPCAHQVVCAKCSELHKKQGMKDCPSCRTPIKQRICARFYRSSTN